MSTIDIRPQTEENEEITKRLKGEKEFILNTMARLFDEITLPVDFEVNTDYYPGKHIAVMDVDLPEIETMPNKKAIKLSTGRLSVKEKTTKELKHDYATCVIGMVFYLSGLVFNVVRKLKK